MTAAVSTATVSLTTERRSALKLVAHAVDALSREPLIDDREGDVAALLLLLDELRTVRQSLATIEAAVEAAAAKLMPRERVELPGFTAQRRGGGKTTSWQHDRIADRLVTELCTDPDTGELQDETYHNANLVREAILDAAAITYWRKSVLRNRGVRVDDLCETERGRFTIQITRAEP